MTTEPHSVPSGIVKVSGVMRGLRKTRAEANFVFTDAGRAKMGIVAVSAAIAGLAGQAISIASASFEEDADYLEFTLDGQPVKGWVWRSPFRESDRVEVAAEWMGTHYEAYAIARPEDRVVALYPHCSRGKLRHYANAVKWWLIGGGGGYTLLFAISLFSDGFDFKEALRDMKDGMVLFLSFTFGFFGLMTTSLVRKWLPFVRLAERCFRALAWPNPSRVDLVKRTKATRHPKDSAEMGVFYFRY